MPAKSVAADAITSGLAVTYDMSVLASGQPSLRVLAQKLNKEPTLGILYISTVCDQDRQRGLLFGGHGTTGTS